VVPFSVNSFIISSNQIPAIPPLKHFHSFLSIPPPFLWLLFIN
jgi:hypothetical protein